MLHPALTALIMRASLLTFVAAATLGVTAGVADAGSNTGTIAVTASIITSCTIATNPLAFGNYDGANTNAATALSMTTTFALTCTTGSTPTVAMGPGNNSTAAQRYLLLSTGPSTLKYNLFQPSSNAPGAGCSTTAWGDGTAATTGTTLAFTTATSKAARTYNLCGTIPAAQDLPTGSYSDSVTATVSF